MKESPKPTPPAPTDAFSALRSEMDRLFDQFSLPTGFSSSLDRVFAGVGDTPIVDAHTDIKETSDAIVITAELPGVSEEDVSLSLDNHVLTVKGEKKSEERREEDNYHRVERRYGSFQRSFRLPESIDEENVTASFDKGVLSVNIAKKPEAQRRPKTIEISKS